MYPNVSPGSSLSKDLALSDQLGRTQVQTGGIKWWLPK